MFRIINNLKNRKGFTLIELIVVLAVLAIIMAIAIPSFMGIQEEARIKGDAATAQQIVKVARLQEASNNDGFTVVGGNDTAGASENDWDDAIMDYPEPKNGTAAGFVLSKDTTKDLYEVTWEIDTGKYAGKDQEVTEGKEFDMTK